MPISSELGGALLAILAHGPGATKDGGEGAAELQALAPLLALQELWSALPAPGRLVVERIRTREGRHLFLYPFLGRRVHDGLAALLAYRLARWEPRTVHLSANDYGIELLTDDPLPLDGPEAWGALLDPAGREEDLLASLNRAEMGRRQFREIARVAGLVLQGFPGRSKSTRQLQVSSGLIYDVLERYDPGNLLLDQTRREVLQREMEFGRLVEGLARLRSLRRAETAPERLTPLAFPIWAERIQAQVSSESGAQRVRRMAARLEKAAGDGT